jgi:hypothetical protein
LLKILIQIVSVWPWPLEMAKANILHAYNFWFVSYGHGQKDVTMVLLVALLRWGVISAAES